MMVKYITFLSVLLLVTAPSWAVEPYEPTQPDPVLEPWRWQTFTELNGMGLQCMAEDRDGTMWFGVKEGVVSYDGITWTTYTSEHGIVEPPVEVLCATRDGSVYAGTKSGISRFKDGVWTRFFPQTATFHWDIWDLVQATDGSLWAATSLGALHFAANTTTLYTKNDLIETLSKQFPDLKIKRIPDHALPLEQGLQAGIDVSTTEIGDGAFLTSIQPGSPGDRAGLKVGDLITAINGGSVRNLSISPDSTASLTVERSGEIFEATVTGDDHEYISHKVGFSDIFEDRRGTIWLGLFRGEIIRFDGEAWTPHALPTFHALSASPGVLRNSLRQSPDGTIWINESSGLTPRQTTGLKPDMRPPETKITLSVDRVSQPGNTTLAWEGADPWQETPEHELQFSQRLNDEPWSPFSTKTSGVFLNLASGEHTIEDGLESRSTDLELGRIFGNPRWKGISEERWPQEAECYTVFFDGGYVSLVSEEPIAEEYLMLIKRFGEVFEYAHSRREELKQKEAQNRRLAVDAAVQRLRAEVQSMDDVSDFEHILSLLTESLKTVDLSFDGNVKLEYDVAEDVGQANTDQGRIRQMLINLLSNAIKFTEEGEVRVDCRLQIADCKLGGDESEVREVEMLEIAVSDTGQGIPEDEILTIFDEYRQVEGSDKEHRGTGLGLSITKQFAELLGGSIGVESQVGKGSTFTVRVPVVYDKTNFKTASKKI